MSLRQPDLERQARKFAGDLTELLNGTVTHGVRMRSYMDRHGRAVVGYKVSEANPVGDCVPLTVSQASARLCFSVLHTLELDDSGAFLTTSKSKPADLHLPVGGRRFRPCLEDIIEFCILERVVGPLAGPQADRATAGHVVDRLERAGPLELQRGAERL